MAKGTNVEEEEEEEVEEEERAKILYIDKAPQPQTHQPKPWKPVLNSAPQSESDDAKGS